MKKRFIFPLITSLFLFLLLAPSAAQNTPPSSQDSSDPDPILIAVMPFTNLAGHKDYEWLSIGIGEVLTTKLGSLACFRLVERNKLSEALKEVELGQTGLIDEKTAPKVGKMVGAEELVLGSFQIVGQSIRIDARFLEVETGRIHVTSGATGEIEKIFELQEKIATSFLSSLNLPLTNEEKNLLAAKPTASMEAFKLYSQALDTHTPKGKILSEDERIALLQKSTQIDPNFVQPNASLGDIYDGRKDYKRAGIYYNKVAVLQPYNPGPSIRLINIYQKQGDNSAIQQEKRRLEEMRRRVALEAQRLEKERAKIIRQKRLEQQRRLEEQKRLEQQRRLEEQRRLEQQRR